MKTFVVGDLHGDWAQLNKLISRHRPNAVLQCGDFGWYPKLHGSYEMYFAGQKQKRWDQYGIKNNDCTVLWCDGNHEDHWSLNKLKHLEVMNNVFYMPRGTVLPLADGRKALFVGGARSVDRYRRTLGVDWFPEEEIDHSLLDKLPDEKIDIVISHTCPKSFFDVGVDFYDFKGFEPSNYALEYVLEKYKPEQWYFGHFHHHETGKYKNTNWTCLNMAGETNWWVEI